MLKTARDSLNLKELETFLQASLRKRFTRDIALEISCEMKDNQVMIIIHADESLNLSSQAIFAEISGVLAKESLSYPEINWQMFLVVHNQLSSQPALASTSNLPTPSLLLPPSVSNSTQLKYLKQLSIYFTPRILMILGAISGGITLIVTSFYILTRPCVIGSCVAIPEAQQLAQNALADFTQANSTEDILKAQQQLQKSINQLKAIPPWSNSYQQASTLIAFYQTRADHLAKIISATETASKAVNLGQNQPLSLSQWQTIQKQWQQALATLAQLPPESPFHDFANMKIAEYQGNLATVEKGLKQEEQAINSLKAANQALQIAKTRQNTAQSVAEWQQVYATWQTAIQRLREINSQTTVYNEAQILLETYQPQLAKAHTRKQQEEFAFNLLKQAQEQAKLAEELANKNQWLESISHWRNSLTYLKQVPNNTFQGNQAQSLITNYTLSLNQAEVNSKNALALEQIRQDIENTCRQNTKICDYRLTNNVIQVTFTQAYLQQVWQTALSAKAEADINQQLELMNHLSRLEQTWQIISNKSGKTLEIYNPDGSFLVRYNPQS